VARRVRIVVGEGRTAQQGLLRFVLEGEGFDVVGEAKGAAALSGVIEANEPDVVVLDDGIGVMAVSMVHEVAPHAKIVLVWPSAVVPIGGDARVEPAKILRDLGPAIEHVMAPVTALTETFERPGWIDKVRKDPATLRSKLAGTKETTKRPSVTRLQRRSKRLHPTNQRPRGTERNAREEDVPAPVVVLPVGTGEGDLEPVLDLSAGAIGGDLVEEPSEERSEWNRRLGTLALSGAAAVSAVALALVLGGGMVPATLTRGGGLFPVGVPGFVQGGAVGQGPFGSGMLGGSGYEPGANDEPTGSDQAPGGAEGDGGLGGELAAPGSGGRSEEPAPADDPGVDPGTDDGGSGDNGGGGDGGGDGSGQPSDSLPGHSADHNPHGGPPGQMGTTPAHGPGLGVGSSAAHGSQGHTHKH
jgi:hypothetical protein